MSKPRWMIDEARFAGRENLDPDHVARYDAKEDTDVRTEVELLRRHGLDSATTLVEIGAGTGRLVEAVAPHCGRVIATDVSPPMLDRLRQRVVRASLDNVEVIEGGFVGLDLVPGVADVVYSRLVLHHLPNFWKAIAFGRLHDLLASGGLFRLVDVVYDFEPDMVATGVEAWCATGRDVRDGQVVEDGWARWEIEEHVRDEHSTFSWLLEAIAERCGFVTESREVQPESMIVSYSFRRR